MHQSWDDALNARLFCDKYNPFTRKLCAAVDEFLLIRKVNIYHSDKPWIFSRIKALIIKWQKLLPKVRKDFPRYREVHNAVQKECAKCKKSFLGQQSGQA